LLTSVLVRSAGVVSGSAPPCLPWRHPAPSRASFHPVLYHKAASLTSPVGGEALRPPTAGEGACPGERAQACTAIGEATIEPKSIADCAIHRRHPWGASILCAAAARSAFCPLPSARTACAEELVAIRTECALGADMPVERLPRDAQLLT